MLSHFHMYPSCSVTPYQYCIVLYHQLCSNILVDDTVNKHDKNHSTLSTAYVFDGAVNVSILGSHVDDKSGDVNINKIVL